MYLGAYSNQSEKEKRSEELILTILAENKEGLLIKEIIERIQSIESVGDKIIRKAIKKLVKDGKVVYLKGEKNEKKCILVDREEKVSEND